MVKLKKDCSTGGCDNVFSCCYWKEKINRAWELATTGVRSIKVNGGAPQYPDGDGSVDVRVTVDTTEIQDQLDAISSEVDQLTSDVLENSADIINLSNLKENVLSAGDGIDIDRASSSTPIISTNVVAQNSDGMFSVWKDESKIAELTEGTNVTISPDGVVSAVDTKYTAGANVTITADNVISATGELSGTASAAQILMDDNRSVQSAIDSIEDEIGDSTTGGTIQSRLEALEESTANLDSELAGKQDSLSNSQMSAVNSGITILKVAKIDLNNANIAQLASIVDTASNDITALKQADVELSKAYSEFSVDKSTSGKIGLTMSAVDGSTSASVDLITAGDNISIANGVISATGGSGGNDWEEVDLVNWDGDWKVGDEFKVIFNIATSSSGGGGWSGGSIREASIGAGDGSGSIPIYGVLLNKIGYPLAVIKGYTDSPAYASLVTLTSTGSATNFYNGGGTMLFNITGIAFNGNVSRNMSLTITANNISQYVYKLWRKKH